METKSVSKLIGAFLSFLFLFACAHTRPSSSAPGTPSQTAQPNAEVFGPAQDMKTEPLPNYGPAPLVTKSVVLVLGPGKAKAFAEAGVIRALSDEKIQIAGIYGVELGALVGALYAVDGSVNHLEWELMHFKNDQLSAKENAIDRFMKIRPSASGLEQALIKAFAERDLSSTKIPLKIEVQPLSGNALAVDKGPIRKALRAAMSSTEPNDFEPIALNGIPSGSAAATEPFPIDEAKKYAQSIGAVVIAVDVLDAKVSDTFPELKNADLIIQPVMKTIGPKDFEKRTDAVFAGKSAAIEKMDEIKHLVNPS